MKKIRRAIIVTLLAFLVGCVPVTSNAYNVIALNSNGNLVLYTDCQATNGTPVVVVCQEMPREFTENP